MLQAGTVRKRARRTLVKVQGLGVLPYNEEEDNFNIFDHFASVPKSIQENRNDTRITMPVNFGREGCSSRVTRDPRFHLEEGVLVPSSDESFGDYYQGGNSSLPQSAGSVVDAQARPYLLSDATMNRIRQIVFVGMMIGSYPWKWNKKLCKVEKWRPELVVLWTGFTFLSGVQTFFIMLYHIHALIGQWARDLESYRGMFAYFFYIYWNAISLSYKIATYYYQDPIRQYINTLLHFNKVYVERYLLFVDKESDYGTGRLVINLAIPAAGCQILNSVMFYLIMPYQPWYFISRIYPVPFYYLIPGALQDISVIGHVIIFYVTTSWLTVAHTNSVEFWLRETHKGNESGYTRESLRSTKFCIESYRALQILCTVFNDCLAPIAIPIMKITVVFGLIPAGFLFIRSLNQTFIDEFPGILVYPFAVLNCATMGFGCLSMGAEMFDIANSFITSWTRTKQKNFRRVLLSCPTLKVKVARFYFITAATTITFFKVITDYITDCIITFP